MPTVDRPVMRMSEGIWTAHFRAGKYDCTTPSSGRNGCERVTWGGRGKFGRCADVQYGVWMATGPIAATYQNNRPDGVVGEQ